MGNTFYLYLLNCCWYDCLCCWKNKRKSSDKKSDLDETVASYSGMNPMPWKAAEGDEDKKRGNIEEFYTGKNPKLANLRTIIYKEQELMKDRAEDVAKRDAQIEENENN